ncbi:hypothetical protein Ancab_000507 [Ancistrocladus abbreviatus]
MAVKLTSCVISKKIPKWVCSIKFLSLASSALHAQIDPHSDQNGSTSIELGPEIQFSRNRLCPDNLIQVLDSTHDLNSAVKIFKWASLQKHFRHTAATYYLMISKLGFGGSVDEMEGFCREMLKDRCPGVEESLVDLMDIFVRNGRLSEAMRVAVTVNSNGYRLDINKFNGLLGALVEEKREFRDIMLIYKEMVKSGVVPNVDTLNHLIKALFDADKVDTALDQFRRLKRKGCVPNTKTFQVVISGLVASNRVDESIGITNEMFEHGFDPDLIFFTNIIPLFCGANMPEEGIRLLNKMRASKVEPDFFIYSVLIRCLCINLWIGDAIKLFQEMKKAGFKPSGDMLVDMISAYCELGKLDEARIFLEDNLVFESSPYNALLQGYCCMGDFLVAKDLLHKMSELGVLDTLSWNILISKLCEFRNVSQAYELLCRMIVSAYAPDSATYSALVVGNCKLSKCMDALRLFHQVREKDWALDALAYGELIEGLCHMEKTQEATDIFFYMTAKNCQLHSSSFNELIKGICVTRRRDEAIRLVEFAYRWGNPVNAATYGALMHGLSRSNRLNDVLVLFSQMLTRGLSLDGEVHCILIKCMSALGCARDCVLFLNLMVNKGLVPDYETLATSLSCLGDHSMMHMILTTIAKLDNEEVLDPDMYNILINGLWKEGYKNEASLLLDSMLEKGWVPDANTHGLLMGSVGREGGCQRSRKPNNCSMDDEISSILSEGLGET